MTNGSVAPGTANTTVCDGSGNITSQIQPLDPLNKECLGDCMFQHEESHRRDAQRHNAQLCVGKPKGTWVLFSNPAEQKAGEVEASEVELSCLREKLPPKSCNRCYQIIVDRIKQMEQYRDRFK